MDRVLAEGIGYFYLQSGEDPASVKKKISPLCRDVDQLMVECLPLMPNVRMVAYSLKSGTYEVLYLHWPEGADVCLVDSKVASGDYGDGDFADSLLSFYQPTFFVGGVARCGTPWLRATPCIT